MYAFYVAALLDCQRWLVFAYENTLSADWYLNHNLNQCRIKPCPHWRLV